MARRIRTFDPGPQRRGKPGRPPGRKNTIRYRESVARKALEMVIPANASEAARATAEYARGVIQKALRSHDPLAFCRPRLLAALVVIEEICRHPTAGDLLDEIEVQR